MENLKNLINDENQRSKILLKIFEEPVSELEKWAKAGFELEIRSILNPFYENMLNKLNQREMNFGAVEEVFSWYLKSRYASPSTLERAYDYIITHRSAVGLEAIALSPNITGKIFQDLIERFRNSPELEIAPNGARFASDYHWAFRRLFANPLNCYSEQSEIEAVFHFLQEFKWSTLPLN